MSYPFSLVLHTHLPMVVNHGRWPHGSDWLNEAAFECYLPLLETAHRLVADGISPKWTINLSPVLDRAARLARIPEGALVLLRERPPRLRGDAASTSSSEGRRRSSRLTHFWEEFYERMWELHRRIGGDIPGTFAELQRGGHVEIITCAATHGYLPLLSRDESIHLQLRTAVETHRRHFGRAPRGHLAARVRLPAALRVDAADRARPRPRAAHAARASRRCWPRTASSTSSPTRTWWRPASRVFLYRDFFAAPRASLERRRPRRCRWARRRSPYAPYRVASRGGTGSRRRLLPRPADHAPGVEPRARLPGRLRLPRVPQEALPGRARASGGSPTRPGDLGTKQVYDPAVAAEKVRAAGQPLRRAGAGDARPRPRDGGPALVCSPYDAELFGHWWFEGPLWLEQVAREMARARRARRMTLGEALEAVPPQRDRWRCPRARGARAAITACGSTARPSGRGTACTAPRREWVGHLDRRATAATPTLKRVLAQATRELLLLQSSDWQFLITTGAARDYAERRVAEHYAEFKRLSEMAARCCARASRCRSRPPIRLRRLEREDFCFPDLDPPGAQAPAASAELAMARRAARPRDDHGRRQGRAPASAHPRALQAVGAVRGALSHHRLRPLQLRELGDARRSTCSCSTSRSRSSSTCAWPGARRASCPTPSSPWCRPRCASAPPGTAAPPTPCCRTCNLIDDFNPDVVAVFGADHIYRMDVSQMLAFHQESGADVTVAARPVPLGEASPFGVLARRPRRAASCAFDEKPARPKRACPTIPSAALVSMGNYLFSRQPLVDALLADARRSTDHDFGRSIIPELVPTGRVFAYDFQTNEVPGVKPYEEQGYWRDVGTVAGVLGRPHGPARRVAALRPRQPPVADPHRPAPGPGRPLHRGRRRQRPRSARARSSSAPPSATRSSAAACGSTRAR